MVGPDLDDDQANERLSRTLAMALGALSVIAVAVLAVELGTHLAAVIEGWGSSPARPRASVGLPAMSAGATLNPLLVVEAVVVEGLMALSLVGLVHLERRNSFALSLTGLIAFNVGSIAFLLFGLYATGRAHTVASVLVPLIGLPIAEVGLWLLFRPGVRGAFRR